MARYYFTKYNIAYGPWGGESVSFDYGWQGGSEVYGYSSQPTWDGSRYVGDRWGAYGMGSHLWGLGNGPTSSYRYYMSPTGYINGPSREYKYTYYTRTRSQSVGTQAQTNILAESDMYPINGVHTDGFWYIRGALYVQPTVTTPGIKSPASIYPTKDAEIGNHSIYNWWIAQDGRTSTSVMGCWDWPSDRPYAGWYGYQGRLLYQYESLPTLPTGSIIIKATLKMYLGSMGKAMSDYNKNYYKENANPIIDVHRITNSWEEGVGRGTVNEAIQNQGVNWTRKSNNRYWNTYGGDIDSTPVASKQIPYTWQTVEFDITNLYKQWQNGTYPNEGLMIKYRNDHIPQGAFYAYMREAATEFNSNFGIPYIELEFNEPPEPARGLQPDNLGTISPKWGPVRLDWDFVDLEAEAIGGKIDLVFMLDGSGSFVDDKSAFVQQLRLYLDRLQAKGSDCRFMLIDHRASRLTKYGWYTNRTDLERQVNNLQPSGGDYSPTHDVFLNTANGARSLAYRSDAEVHLVFMTDEGLRSSSSANKQEVANWAIANRYKIWTIIHGCYLGSFPEFSIPTGGQNIDLHIEWNKHLPIPASQTQAGSIESGDYQTRADVRIWRVEAGGARTLLKTLTTYGSTSHIDVDPATIPLVNRQVYEWDVKTYDSSNLSAVSKKAIFTYRDDDGSFDTTITWGGLPKVGEIVKRSDIYQVKEELAKLIPLYPHMKPSILKQLFAGDIVPSRKDTAILKEVLTEMVKSTALQVSDVWTRDFIDDDLLDPNDIEYIRTVLDIIKNQGPLAPPKMEATEVISYLTAPVSITATNGGLYSSYISLTWAPPVEHAGGFVIKTRPSASRNLLFYRVFYNSRRSTRIRNKNGSLANNTEMFHTFFQYTPQMFEDGGIGTGTSVGEIFIAKDGETSFNEIYVKAVDTEGHYSPASYVDLKSTGASTHAAGNVSYYRVEYQIADIDAIQSDSSGKWTLLDNYVTKPSISFNLNTTGTVWFRIQAVTSSGKQTDYAYTTTPIKLLL